MKMRKYHDDNYSYCSQMIKVIGIFSVYNFQFLISRLKIKIKELADQYALSEQQYAQKVSQPGKSLFNFVCDIFLFGHTSSWEFFGS